MKALSKIALVTVLGIVGSILFFSLLIKPSLNRVEVLASSLSERKQLEATLEQQVFAYRTAQSDLSKATQRQKILAVFVEKENLVEAIKNLEAGAALTGTRHDLKIQEQDPNLPANAKIKEPPVLNDKLGLKEIPYQLSTVNDFVGTVRFLSFMEHLPQFTEMSKLNLSAEIIEGASTTEPIRTGNVLGDFNGVFVIKSNEAK